MARYSRPEAEANKLLDDLGIVGPPVDVHAVAGALGIEVRSVIADDSWSGMLYRDENQTIIAVNSKHNEKRKRFTIAHELGHLKLSQDADRVFIDTTYYKFRTTESALGIDKEEIEANEFAGNLLMPRKFLKQDLDQELARYEDLDFVIPVLARKYRVSQQAMTVRILRLSKVL